MSNGTQFTFKVADCDKEFELIHKLNYSTFVEEIPQHTPNDSKKLVDSFHQENTYIICMDKAEDLAGMICFRDKRPFSLDKKIDNLDKFIPCGRKACEIRLLSVKKEHRNGTVFFGLLNKLADISIQNGFDMALISGTTRQQKLYQHLGFKPFHDIVGSGDARFVPMYLTLEDFKRSTQDVIDFEHIYSQVNLMPGPVNISDAVRSEFSMKPISHRSSKFLNDFQQIKKKLCSFVSANYVEIFTGSGTLGNDVVAAQLAALGSKGLVLSNGEFGERLLSHAERSKLDYIALRKNWGEQYNENEIRQLLKENPDIGWIWSVHCETSVGIINDMEMLLNAGKENNIKLCMDCISSIGTMPLSLRNLYLATGVSGKAICAYPGLALVFYNEKKEPDCNIPRYFDLGFYSHENGIPFTINTNLVYALNKAMDSIFETEKMFEGIRDKADKIRNFLIESGFKVLNPREISSPAVVTVQLPDNIKSLELGEHLELFNCFISYRSKYLVERNLIQVYITRNTTDDLVARFLEIIRKYRQYKGQALEVQPAGNN